MLNVEKEPNSILKGDASISLKMRKIKPKNFKEYLILKI